MLFAADGFKGEANHPLLWAENSSFTLYGFGGMASADSLPADPMWPKALFILSGGSNATLYSLPTRAVCHNTSSPDKWSVVYQQPTMVSRASPAHGGAYTAPLDFPAKYASQVVSLKNDEDEAPAGISVSGLVVDVLPSPPASHVGMYVFM